MRKLVYTKDVFSVLKSFIIIARGLTGGDTL